jgi:hypothetical protein
MVIDVTNPGLVSVAGEAYPAVLEVASAEVPLNLGDFLAASLFAPRFPAGVGASVFPTPLDAPVENQPALPIRFSGVPAPTIIEVDIGQQNLAQVDVESFVVTDLEQNLPNSLNEENIKEFTVVEVQNADTGMPLTAPAQINGASNTSPILITTVQPHNFNTGDVVTVVGVRGNTAADGTWNIRVTSPTAFELLGTAGNNSIPIVNATNASPILVVTSVPTTYRTGDSVTISGVTGNTNANGTFNIQVVEPNLLLLQGSNGNANYTGGGDVTLNTITGFAVPAFARYRIRLSPSLGQYGISFLGREVLLPPTVKNVVDATFAIPIVITTDVDHEFETGDQVEVEGVTGNFAANGLWNITKIDDTSFSLDDSVGDGVYAGGGTAILTVSGGQAVALNSRVIEYYNGPDQIVINKNEPQDAITVQPTIGDKVYIDVSRQGSEVVGLGVNPTVEVNPSTSSLPGLQTAPTVVIPGTAASNRPASTGVVQPFIGSGTPSPRFDGNVQVANQSIVQGLPVNVNA